MFIDEASIQVSSGKGGDGCVSFRREKFVPKGGPDGGDGGRGGSVILEACSSEDTLQVFAGHHHWQAPNGQPGAAAQRSGKHGEHVVVPVPVGTLIYDASSGHLLADLSVAGDRFIAAAGGDGGYGNARFKTATNQAPRRAEPGEPATCLPLRLELKLVADIGLVGLPNAGKSSLLAALTEAHPKVADYPFTTLEPALGIAALPTTLGTDARRLVIADIPGLIEGASDGIGLGHAFLRHIERTRLLLHLVDFSPEDGSDPVENHRTVMRELQRHSSLLAVKPQIMAATKMDLLSDDADRMLAAEMLGGAVGMPVTPISSATGFGLRGLLESCWEAVTLQRAEEQAPEARDPDSEPA